MKTIRIRIQYLNTQDIIARKLVNEIPEDICPKQVEFQVLSSNVVRVTVKGHHTGTWHGNVEASFPIDLDIVEKKVGKYIIIENN